MDPTEILEPVKPTQVGRMGLVVVSQRSPLPVTPDYSERDLALMRDIFPKELTEKDFRLFTAYCLRRGLDPITKQVYALAHKDRKTGKHRMSIVTSIEGFRLIAERNPEYDGQEGPEWCGADGVWRDIWLDKVPPAAARVRVKRKDHSVNPWSTALFHSYCPRLFDGKPSGLWSTMPEHMIGKVAEALALRRAFPDMLSGIYTTEEMDQARGAGARPDVVAPAPAAAFRDSELELDAAPGDDAGDDRGMVEAEAAADDDVPPAETYVGTKEQRALLKQKAALFGVPVTLLVDVRTPPGKTVNRWLKHVHWRALGQPLSALESIVCAEIQADMDARCEPGTRHIPDMILRGAVPTHLHAAAGIERGSP